MELNLSIQIFLHIVAEVGDAVLVKMLCLGHQAVRHNVTSSLGFFQFIIADFARVLLVL